MVESKNHAAASWWH